MPKSWLEGKLSVRSLEFNISVNSKRLAVVGPSGSGKSTLLKILAGVGPRARGFLRVGTEIWQDAKVFMPPGERRVGWVPQNALLFPHLSVRENLMFSPKAREFRQVSQALGIDTLLDRWPRNLSGGEAQRVALGRALLSQPRLLLLDEPFSALNDTLRVNIVVFLARYCIENDIPLIFATHRFSEAEALCEEVLGLGGEAALPARRPVLPQAEGGT